MIKTTIQRVLLIESLKSAKEFATKSNISQEVFDKFNALDTTPTKKLIHQILKWYVADNTLDVTDELKKELDVFIKFSGGRIKQAIEQFKTHAEFTTFITPFLDIETKADKKDELAGQYKKIFENENMLVVLPFTHKASCIYGAKTKWCTTAKTAEHFNRYQEQGNSIYYVINKLDNDENNPFHKMAVVVNQAGAITQCFDTFDSSQYTPQIQKWISNHGVKDMKSVFAPLHDSEEMFNAIVSKFKNLKSYEISGNTLVLYKKIIDSGKLDEIFPQVKTMVYSMNTDALLNIPTSVKNLSISRYSNVKNLASINDGRDIKVSISITTPRIFTNCNNIDITLKFCGNLYNFAVNTTLMASTKNMIKKSKFKLSTIKVNTTDAYSYGGTYFTVPAFSNAIKYEITSILTGAKKVVKKKSAVASKKRKVPIVPQEDEQENDGEL